MDNKIKTVAVYCGHQAGNNPEYLRDAQRIGELLGRNKFTLVFGGGEKKGGVVCVNIEVLS